MNPITLIALSIVVGWLATLVLHADVDRVSVLDFGIGIVGAAIAARMLAPLVGVSITSDYGLTLSGTALTFGGAVVLLALVNLLRHRRIRS